MDQVDPSHVKFTGEDFAGHTRVQIVVCGVPRALPQHTSVRNHGASGFGWGYIGAGSAQLALAMCVELVGAERALRVFQAVNHRLVKALNPSYWELLASDLIEVIEKVEALPAFGPETPRKTIERCTTMH